jgi:hypothetical protein
MICSKQGGWHTRLAACGTNPAAAGARPHTGFAIGRVNIDPQSPYCSPPEEEEEEEEEEEVEEEEEERQYLRSNTHGGEEEVS